MIDVAQGEAAAVVTEGGRVTPVARRRGLKRAWAKHRFYYLLATPGLLYFLLFHYVPMFGIIIAFKDIPPFASVHDILTAPWVGFANFLRFFHSYFFGEVMANTLIISGLKLLFGFPAPIILALLLNEIRWQPFKRVVQTISYMPHFLSMVVVAALVTNILTPDGGLLNAIIVHVGGSPHLFLGDPHDFRAILVITTIWQDIGWGSILYLAAMANIDPELYRAAMVDGANRWQQVLAVTLPGIGFVTVILLIFAVGNLLNAGFEQILLLYSPSVYSVADIIDTYVYRAGLLSQQYSFGAAVGLFKSALALTLLLASNAAARRFSGSGLW